MKKIFVLLLCLLLAVSVIAGCGSDKKTDGTSSATKSTAQTSVQNNDSSKSNVKQITIEKDGSYTDKVHVAAYINQFSKLPKNYITKAEAKKLGWQTKGTLDKVAPGKSIGGDRYGNYEKKLPDKNGRFWKECDIDYVKGNRNAKRIVFSNDGLIYYTEDHYNNFQKLY